MVTDLENEANVIAGLLRHPQLFSDIPFINESDFSDGENYNKLIFSVLKRSSEESKSLDIPIIANEIAGISITSDFDFLSYLEALKYRAVSEKGLLESCAKLKTVTVRRELCETASNIIQEMKAAKDKNFDEIISLADEIYSKATRSYTSLNEPIDLFSNLEELIESNGNLADDESEEIINPFPRCQKLFGGFFPGDLCLYMSAAKEGKSLLLMNTLLGCVEQGIKDGRPIKTLLIDTELESFRVMRRLASVMSGVSEYHLKNNGWRKSPEMVKAVRAIWPDVQRYFNTIDHVYVGNCSNAEMISICRRWHYKNVRAKNIMLPEGEKNKRIRAIGAIDYFKLTMVENVKEAFHSSLELGYKVDSFKKLASELMIPLLGAAQTNQQGNVGLSYEIRKFVSSLFKFRRKTSEEKSAFADISTHLLEPDVTRDQGPEAEGFDLVQVDVGGRIEYKKNHINFRVEKFKVQELNTFKDQVEAGQHDDGKIKRKTKAKDEF